jgi:hypothetical protein
MHLSVMHDHLQQHGVFRNMHHPRRIEVSTCFGSSCAHSFYSLVHHTSNPITESMSRTDHAAKQHAADMPRSKLLQLRHMLRYLRSDVSFTSLHNCDICSSQPTAALVPL